MQAQKRAIHYFWRSTDGTGLVPENPTTGSEEDNSFLSGFILDYCVFPTYAHVL
jgi:hypothetical protein